MLCGNVEVALGLSNYASKANLKKAAGADTSAFAKRTVLASLKSGVDELDINKLKIVPVNLSKQSIVVNNDVIKKAGIIN